MPYYIAGGRDIRGGCAVKIFAQTPEEAFALAKERLPMVAGLERIEEDGSTVAMSGLPFDSLEQEMVSDSEKRHEQGRKAAEHWWQMRLLFWIAIASVVWRCLAFVFSQAAAPQPQPAATVPNSPPASTATSQK